MNQTVHKTIKYSEADVYSGDTINGIRNGYGNMTYSNGRSFVGEWLNDKKHGFGREYDEDSELVFEGHYKEGDYLRGTFYDGDFFYKFWRNSEEREDFKQETKNLNLEMVEQNGLIYNFRLK